MLFEYIIFYEWAQLIIPEFNKQKTLPEGRAFCLICDSLQRLFNGAE